MGDYIEFFAEIDLLGALSACPGGDTSSGHSDDTAKCYPLLVQVFEPGNKEVPLAKKNGLSMSCQSPPQKTCQALFVLLSVAQESWRNSKKVRTCCENGIAFYPPPNAAFLSCATMVCHFIMGI